LTLNYQRSNLKCRCKIHSTLRRSNYNCKNMRLHVKTKEQNILSPTTAQFTTARRVLTNVSLNTSSRAQKVCASNSARPGLQDRSNKGVKHTQSWNSAGYNLRNKLRFCPNVLSITSFRALQVCAWNVAYPGFSYKSNRGVKFTQPWNCAAHNCKSSLRKCLFEYESSQVQ